LTNPKKRIWSNTKLNKINPQNGIDLYDNKSIIIRILFAITIFQQKEGIEDMIHETLKSGGRITHAKGHDQELIVTLMSYKCIL
jgi:hypothetical protein